MTLVKDRAFWNDYLNERTGTYEFRCIRYKAVLGVMLRHGFRQFHSVCDIGAGRQEFGQYLREQGHHGDYLPVDGSIDGTDLEMWTPNDFSSWMVAIEVIEHLHDPQRMLQIMEQFSENGFVITTPNPETVDVLAIDRTHVSVIWPLDLALAGVSFTRATLFASPEYRRENDSLLGWQIKK